MTSDQGSQMGRQAPWRSEPSREMRRRTPQSHDRPYRRLCAHRSVRHHLQISDRLRRRPESRHRPFLAFPQPAGWRKSLEGFGSHDTPGSAQGSGNQPSAPAQRIRIESARAEDRLACSASTNGISSRTIKVAIGVAADPNPGSCGRCVEACAHAFSRCSAESRE
jgi:hypothetical protein